ncbi:MAG: ABC transporter ATP-binding protein [Oscillospiraceae bacterium]|nr:ABC transporter ATP-binding protein [Oscillospiraceae bacterium]
MQQKKQGKWFRYARPYLPYFIIGPLCMIAEVIGEVLMPKCLSLVINRAEELEKAGDAASADQSGVLFSLGVAGVMVLIALAMMAGGIGGAYFGAKASVNFAADLRSDVYARVQQFSFANIDRFSTGSLVTRLTNDVTQMQNMVNMLLRMALRAPGMLIGALIMAILLRPSLAVVLAVTIPLMVLCIVLLILRTYPMFSNVQGKIDRLNSTVQENVTNVRVVKSFVREEYEKGKFYNANRDLKSTSMRAMRLMIFMSPIMTLFMNITTIAVLWFGGDMVYSGDMPIGDLSAFITYVTQILSSLMMVTMLLMMLARAMASAKRISEVLEEPITLTDDGASRKELTVQEGRIEFRDVSFRYYKNSENAVLDKINLTIQPRTVVGIIGSTGCGKSTLVSMIPRLYDVDEGQVLVDGVDVREYSLFHLREGVGMVLQKNVLFSGSISDNLRWGDEEATDEQLRAAAESAQANQFVEAFPGGYLYDLGQGGKNVSGGQKQRLCIARALLKKPKILILDDSTSAVDTATEARIREAFRNELADSTKIVIAQRITSVMEADQIVVLNEGRITGVGTHEELLKTNREYREIYESQMDRKADEGV